MPLISRSCIESIKNKVELYDVVSPYMNLKRSGSHWKGLSPFSNEKTPSFYVLTDKNIFKCFSTGYAGDVFRFIQLKENLSFQEAIETIAHRFNVPLEYEAGGRGADKGGSQRKAIYEIYEIAAHYYCACFKAKDAEGEQMRKYWTEERQFSLGVAKEAMIGLAPSKGEGLMKLLTQKKMSPDAIQQSGLFYVPRYGGQLSHFRSRFRGRLMIPVRDVQDRVIAFAGRKTALTPEEDPTYEAKYINSPETAIFNKGRTLFGLNRARKRVDGDAGFIVVEGQLDALRCWEKGFERTVAPQGTAITEQQLATLKHYSDKILFVLDGDAAGQRAALRALPMAFKAGLEVAFATLAEGVDPDDFLAREGAEGFSKLLSEGVSGVVFALNALSPKGSKGWSPQQKANILSQIFEILAHCESTVVQEEYLFEVCQLMQVSRQALEEDFRYFKGKRRRGVREEQGQYLEQNSKKKLTSVEYQLLLIVLNYEKIANSLAQILNPEWIIPKTIEAQLLTRIFGELKEDLWQGKHHVDTILETDEEKNLIYSILYEKPPFEDPLKTANICMKNLYKQFLNKQKQTIDLQMANCSADESNRIEELQRERVKLRLLQKEAPSIC